MTDPKRNSAAELYQEAGRVEEVHQPAPEHELPTIPPADAAAADRAADPAIAYNQAFFDRYKITPAPEDQVEELPRQSEESQNIQNLQKEVSGQIEEQQAEPVEPAKSVYLITKPQFKSSHELDTPALTGYPLSVASFSNASFTSVPADKNAAIGVCTAKGSDSKLTARLLDLKVDSEETRKDFSRLLNDGQKYGSRALKLPADKAGDLTLTVDLKEKKLNLAGNSRDMACFVVRNKNVYVMSTVNASETFPLLSGDVIFSATPGVMQALAKSIPARAKITPKLEDSTEKEARTPTTSNLNTGLAEEFLQGELPNQVLGLITRAHTAPFLPGTEEEDPTKEKKFSASRLFLLINEIYTGKGLANPKELLDTNAYLTYRVP
jgi:hypothetical protein